MKKMNNTILFYADKLANFAYVNKTKNYIMKSKKKKDKHDHH